MTSMKITKAAQAFMLVQANDDVIEQFNLEQLAGTHQIARHPNISFGWIG